MQYQEKMCNYYLSFAGEKTPTQSSADGLG